MEGRAGAAAGDLPGGDADGDADPERRVTADRSGQRHFTIALASFQTLVSTRFFVGHRLLAGVDGADLLHECRGGLELVARQAVVLGRPEVDVEELFECDFGDFLAVAVIMQASATLSTFFGSFMKRAASIMAAVVRTMASRLAARLSLRTTSIR